MKLKYRVFTGILNQVEEMKALIKQIPDLTNLTILNNYDNPQAEELCKELEKQGAEVLRYPWNPGAAVVFNVALSGVDRQWDSPMREGLDYVVIVSPSCIFKNDLMDFIKVVEEEEAKAPNYFYWAPSNEHHTDMQCQAIMRRCVEKAGIFDENFVPYSFEDTDYGRRMWLAGAYKTQLNIDRSSQGLSLPLSKEHRLLFHYQLNAAHIHDYYVKKWGGEHTFEKFEHPFNNPSADIKEWHREEDQIAKLPDA
jgi:hypothetical protein